MVDGWIEKIERELQRLAARAIDVGAAEEIRIDYLGDDYGLLKGAPLRQPLLRWVGRSEEIHERLAGLPDRGGPEAIRSAFQFTHSNSAAEMEHAAIDVFGGPPRLTLSAATRLPSTTSVVPDRSGLETAS